MSDVERRWESASAFRHVAGELGIETRDVMAVLRRPSDSHVSVYYTKDTDSSEPTAYVARFTLDGTLLGKERILASAETLARLLVGEEGDE